MGRREANDSLDPMSGLARGEQCHVTSVTVSNQEDAIEQRSLFIDQLSQIFGRLGTFLVENRRSPKERVNHGFSTESPSEFRREGYLAFNDVGPVTFATPSPMNDNYEIALLPHAISALVSR